MCLVLPCTAPAQAVPMEQSCAVSGFLSQNISELDMPAVPHWLPLLDMLGFIPRSVMKECCLGSWCARRSRQRWERGAGGEVGDSQGLRLLHGKLGEYQLQAAWSGYNRHLDFLQWQGFCQFKSAFKLSPWQPCRGTAECALGSHSHLFLLHLFLLYLLLNSGNM